MPETKQPSELKLKDGRLKFDSGNFWKKTYEALVNAADGDWGSALDKMLSSDDSNTPEHKAYRLIYNALHRTCVGILADERAQDQLRLLEKMQSAGLAKTVFYHDLSRKLGSGEFSIDASFFSAPQRLPLIEAARGDYADFLREVLQIGEAHALALAAVLPARFTSELAYEWNQADYSALEDYFNNPFFKVLAQTALREKRHAELLRRFAKPAFNDPNVTLAEMYVAPQFWVHGRCINEESGKNFEKIEDKGERFHFYQHKQHKDLHAYFLHWLRGQSPMGLKAENDRMLMLLGHPGQGKTSFSLRVADQLLREHPGLVDNVYVVRLRDVTAIEKLLAEPLRTLREQPAMRAPDTDILPENELRNSLLLLDGLDELYMSKGLSLDDIQEFIRRLRQELVTLSREVEGLRTVFTSRTNYLKLDGHREDDYLVLHLAEFSLDQQLEWLEKYSRYYEGLNLTKDKLTEINRKDNKAFAKICELVSQPILLQMIAVADIQIDEKANSALIYNQLFTKLIKRDWSEDKEKQLDKYRGLSETDLRRFLRVLALHIFQKPEGQEYARRNEFEDPDTRLGREVITLAKKMGMAHLSLKDFARNLLVSAYFQEVERSGEEKKHAGDYDDFAYEFLHKTLQEYLVAEQIWQECSRFLLEKDDDGRDKIETARQVMEKIHPLFSPKIITNEIAEYLREIIQNDNNVDKAELKERLKEFLPELLQNSFLWKHEAKSHEPSALEKMAGNFFGYWTIASALIQSHNVNPIQEEKQFQTIIAAENLIAEHAKKTFSDLLILLQRTAYRLLDLRYNDLRGADLRGAYLRGAYLSGAYLRGAYLRGADLSRAYLSGAYLSGAYLSGADLSGAYLRGAYLSGADLRGAYLSRADLSRADLRGADLRGADLRGADLRGADLRGAYLSRADLRGAYLSRADLRGANFENADLTHIEGIETAYGLNTANFKGTIYEGKFPPQSPDKE